MEVLLETSAVASGESGIGRIPATATMVRDLPKAGCHPTGKTAACRCRVWAEDDGHVLERRTKAPRQREPGRERVPVTPTTTSQHGKTKENDKGNTAIWVQVHWSTGQWQGAGEKKCGFVSSSTSSILTPTSIGHMWFSVFELLRIAGNRDVPCGKSKVSLLTN